MKRRELLKRLRRIAKVKGVHLTFEEGSNHTIVRFDDRKVTIVGRHAELPEPTARRAIRDAQDWT